MFHSARDAVASVVCLASLAPAAPAATDQDAAARAGLPRVVRVAAVRDDRHLAAAELYRLTEEGRWHAIFLETTAFTAPKVDLGVRQHHGQAEAAWVYLAGR